MFVRVLLVIRPGHQRKTDKKIKYLKYFHWKWKTSTRIAWSIYEDKQNTKASLECTPLDKDILDAREKEIWRDQLHLHRGSRNRKLSLPLHSLWWNEVQNFSEITAAYFSTSHQRNSFTSFKFNIRLEAKFMKGPVQSYEV